MTEYRLIPCITTFGDKYLQFKRTVTKKNWLGNQITKDEWCFIPTFRKGRHQGPFYQNECPTLLPVGEHHSYLNCFFGQEHYDLIPFTREYPNIDMYFRKIRDSNDWIEQLEKERQKFNKIDYL